MDLEIVNDPEDGIVAVDRDTGDRVPVPMDELDVQSTYSESINTEEALSDLPLGDDNAQSQLQSLQGVRKSEAINAAGNLYKPVVAWVFDDVPESVYNNRGVFDSNDADFSPCLAVNVNNTDVADFMSWNQVDDMVENYGAYVMNHSINGDEFDTLSVDELRDHVLDATAEFYKNGYAPREFVYPKNKPGGANGWKAVAQVCNYAFGGGDRPIIDEENPYQLPRQGTDQRDLSTLESVVDDAIANDGVVVFNGHELIDGTVSDEGNLETSTEKVRHIAQYVRDQGGEMGTVGDVVRHMKSPRRIGHGDASYNIHGAHKFTLAPGEPWYIEDENGNVIVNARQSDGTHYIDAPGGFAWNMGDFSTIDLGGQTLSFYDNGNDIFSINDTRIHFRGRQSEGVPVGGTPADSSSPAAWETVEGDDGSTYYRPLYQ